ncbi:MAG: hypothetical protein ACLQVI_35605 [Polyangiaceae bacterium]
MRTPQRYGPGGRSIGPGPGSDGVVHVVDVAKLANADLVMLPMTMLCGTSCVVPEVGEALPALRWHYPSSIDLEADPDICSRCLSRRHHRRAVDAYRRSLETIKL